MQLIRYATNIILILLYLYCAPGPVFAVDVYLTARVLDFGGPRGTITLNPPGRTCDSNCSIPYIAGTTVTLKAIASTGTTFSRWAGACNSLRDTCEVTINSNETVYAYFQPTTTTNLRLLSISNEGSGSGIVTSNPSGIICGTDCTEYYEKDTIVNLKATSSSDSIFTGWSSPCSGTNDCQITMDSTKSVSANFIKSGTSDHYYNLTPINMLLLKRNILPDNYDCNGDKDGSAFLDNCDVCVEGNTGLTVCTQDCEGIWGGNASLDNCGTCNSDPSNDCTQDCNGVWGGSSVVDDCGVCDDYPTNDNGTCAQDCNGDWDGTAYLDDCGICVGGNTGLNACIKHDCNVTLSGTGSGTVTSSPTGISCGVDCSETYVDGTLVTLSASSSSGSIFTGWTGACSGTGSCQLSMDEPKLVSATFDIAKLIVSKTGTGTGTVVSNPIGIVCDDNCSNDSNVFDGGIIVTLTASASANSIFTGWSGDCIGTGGCQITMAAAKSVIANFEYSGACATGWEWANPLPQGNSLSGVASNGTKIVAVGESGTILSSLDAQTWTIHPHSYDLLNDLYTIAWGNNQFVVGSSGGTFLTSPDGNNWTKRTTSTGHNIFSVIWGNGKYVAGGAAGTIFTSPDAINWTIRDSGTSNTSRDIAWNGSLFVAVGDNGSIITSPDGINWTIQISSTDKQLRSISWNGSKFVVSGGVINLNSFDGINWTQQSSNNGIDILWSEDLFVTVGVNGLIQTSPDGIIWTTQSSGTTNLLNSVIWDGNIFVAVGIYGTLLTSPDAINWSEQTSSITYELISDITSDGNQFVAVGNDGILTSQDGMNWLKQLTEYNLSSIAWNGSIFVASGTSGLVYISSDGNNWAMYDSGINNSFYAITWSGNQFVAVGSSGLISTSPDGINWTERLSSTNASLFGVAGNNDGFIAVGNSRVIVTSPDGINWSTQTIETSNRYTDIIWNGNQYVIIGSPGTILTSPDGINWTQQSSGTTVTPESIIWNGNQFVSVGDKGIILTSPDAITWTEQYRSTAYSPVNDFMGIAWNGNRFVAVGYNGTIFVSNDCSQ